MKKNFILGLSILTSIAIFGMNSCDKNKKVKLNTQKDSISWVLGENMAQGLKETGLDIDKKIFLKAVENVFDGKQGPLDDTTFNKVLQEAAMIMITNQQNKMAETAETAMNNEAKYFKELKANNPDIKSTESGLCYKVVKQGEGRKAFSGGRVRFHYKASLADGKVFDQTYEVREPILTLTDNVFPGLQEGLKLMPAGSHYIFYIPSHLAFGPNGSEDVPPYTAVIYEIELIHVLD